MRCAFSHAGLACLFGLTNCGHSGFWFRLSRVFACPLRLTGIENQMDALIRRFDCSKDDDLMLCPSREVAYQRDMSKGKVVYDANYLATFDSPAYSQSGIAMAVNAGRVEMLARNLAGGASVLDVGAASGAFVRAARATGYKAFGFDIIPEAVARLRSHDLYADDPAAFDAVTMWDSLEHMEDPGAFLNRIQKGRTLFGSVPMMRDIERVRDSKHYKPGEHFYYWTLNGFLDYMKLYGFRGVEISKHEIDAGRQDVLAFAFKRDLPDYRDHIAAYMEMHATRYYGNSATELHLSTVAGVVRAVQPQSILDYGCGRSDLVAHFWYDGKRKIARYDPAIPAIKTLPDGKFDIVLVCDVMEHVPMAYVDKVLIQIRAKSDKAIFTISTKPSRAKLPDGRNAHVTLLTHAEWRRWIAEYFGPVAELPSAAEHELVLVAGDRTIQGMRRAA